MRNTGNTGLMLGNRTRDKLTHETQLNWEKAGKVSERKT